MTVQADWTSGACHCGGVRFRVRLTDGLRSARRCTCSYCRMRGAVAVSAALDDIRFTAGEDVLSEYRFHTGTARHFFCSRCGIYTHHRRRSDPTQIGVNAACLEGVSPFDFREVPVNDGVNHPADHADGPRLAGMLRFEAADGGPAAKKDRPGEGAARSLGRKRPRRAAKPRRHRGSTPARSYVAAHKSSRG